VVTLALVPAAILMTRFVAIFVTVMLVMLAAAVLPHPRFMDEVDRLSAGRIVPAVAAPIGLLNRRHIKVDRLLVHRHRRRCNDDRLLINDRRWWHVAQIDAAIDTGLIDADRYPDVCSSKCGR